LGATDDALWEARLPSGGQGGDREDLNLPRSMDTAHSSK
jgi:hypothetical protein